MNSSYGNEILKSSGNVERLNQNKKIKNTISRVSYRFNEQESTALDTVYFALFEHLTTNTPIIELTNRVKYNNL